MSSAICFDALTVGICKTQQRNSAADRMLVNFLRQDLSVIFRDVALADKQKLLVADASYDLIHYENATRKEVFSQLSDEDKRNVALMVVLNLPKIGINLPMSTTIFMQKAQEAYTPISLTALVHSYVVTVGCEQSIALKRKKDMIPMDIRGVERTYASNKSSVLFQGYARTLDLEYSTLSPNDLIANYQKLLVLDTLDNFVLFNYFVIKKKETIITQVTDDPLDKTDINQEFLFPEVTV